METLATHLQQQQHNMLEMLRRFVNTESPSTDQAAVNRFRDVVGKAAGKAGGRLRYRPSRLAGNFLRAEFPFAARRSAGQILLLGHLDTVWEPGTLRRMPFRVSKGRAYGPGVFDMKSGIVIALCALQALRDLKIPVRTRVVLLLVPDEEIGSPTSRTVTEKEALRSDCVLVLEPAQGREGALKTARKGTGEFEIRAHGRAAHAGLEPEKGASAIAEICRQVLHLESFADARRGITINPGIITGGTRTNVVAPEAVVKVDVRVARAGDMQKIERTFRSLKAFGPGTSVEVSGRFNRPPMERTAATSRLFQRAGRVAGSLGIPLAEASAGGASDGNFTAALGIPTLDGLGAVGEGAHAAHENIVIGELPRRSALLAHLIADLGEN